MADHVPTAEELAQTLEEVLVAQDAFMAQTEKDAATIADLQAENASLRDEKIRLQKVASAPAVDADRLTSILDEMEARQILVNSRDREKVASHVQTSPNGLMDLLERTLEVTRVPLDEGYGVSSGAEGDEASKNASDNSTANGDADEETAGHMLDRLREMRQANGMD